MLVRRALRFDVPLRHPAVLIDEDKHKNWLVDKAEQIAKCNRDVVLHQRWQAHFYYCLQPVTRLGWCSSARVASLQRQLLMLHVQPAATQRTEENSESSLFSGTVCAPTRPAVLTRS